MSRTNWPALITGIAIGAGVGAAIGILFAPQSGEDTRNDLMGSARDRLNDVKDRFSDVTDRFSDVTNRVNNVVETGKDFVRQAQDTAEHVKGHVKDLADAGQRAYREAKNA